MNKKLENFFVIGDVHGCYHTLLNLVKKLPSKSELIFVGDLCDKGNYSKEVIEFVIKNNYRCVKGNHEHFFQKYIIDAIEKNKKTFWSSDFRFGGVQSINSYKKNINLIKKHLKWIKQLPLFIKLDKYFITHGFALEYYNNRNNTNYHHKILFNRLHDKNKEPNISEDIINIFGHCTFDEVQVGNKFFGIDTGCSNGGKLTAIQLGVHKIYQEPMNKKDSSYKLRELELEHINLETFSIKEIENITLKDNCKYKDFDIVSNNVLKYIQVKYPLEVKNLLLTMKEKSIIFPKQLEKFL